MKLRLETLRNLPSLLKELAVGLRNLSFADNFDSFQTEVTIAANTEKQIRNQLTKPASSYIIVRKSNGSEVADGPTEWTSDFLYLKNYDATNAVTVTVIFFK